MVGIICGHLLSGSISFRDVLGVTFGRGHLLALAQREGIYEADLERALAELRYTAGIDQKDRQGQNIDKRLILERLASSTVARSCATNEKIPRTKIDRELRLLRCQFQDDKGWRRAVKASGLSQRSLHRAVVTDLRARQWIDRQIKPTTNATISECQTFYDAHPQNFSQPVRFRASHLFLAAPPDISPDLAEAKRRLIESLAARIGHGENFSELVALFSEDEATKTHGGDLRFFSASRMPSDFLAAIMKMRVGETSDVVRTRLGFHIIQLTEFKPARQMLFDEARAEISLMLENEKRAIEPQKLAAALLERAAFVRSPF